MATSASVTADWTILEIEGVMDVAERAARAVARQYSAMEFDDLLQEAYIILATKSDQMRTAIDGGGLGRLHHEVWEDLTDMARTQQRRADRNLSLDAVRGEVGE